MAKDKKTRQRKWTGKQKIEIQRRLLAALEDGCIIREACEAAGTSVMNYSNWVRKDPLFAFEANVALEAGAWQLETEATVRAVQGTKRYKFTSKGQPILWRNPETGDLEHYAEFEKSDQLLMFLMRSRAPNRFDDVQRREAQKAVSEAFAKATDSDGTSSQSKALETVKALLKALETGKSAE